MGLTLELDLRDNIQRDLYYLGEYESDLVKFVLSELQPGDVFVDVGAHIGVYALPAARRLAGTGRVIAFEPDAGTAATLAHNAEVNEVSALTVVRKALGSRAGTAFLRASESSAYLPEDSAVRSMHGKGTVVSEIEVISFDAWAAANSLERVDVIKIDVEGNEYDALMGMTRCLRSYKPRMLIVEVVARHLERAGATPSLLEKLLEKHGYRADGPTIQDIARRSVGPFWPNAVMRRTGQVLAT